MTDIQKYTIQNPLTVAEHFAKSGLFEDSRDMSKALVKILAGRELGLPDMASMTGIHIIKGKPVLGANLIASLIKGSGKYDYKVLEMSDKVCSIDFYQSKQKLGNSLFTLEDAQKAGTQNINKFPRNMLFARAISNGAKWFCPDVFNGQTVYTEGELPEPQPIDIDSSPFNQYSGELVEYYDEEEAPKKKFISDLEFYENNQKIGVKEKFISDAQVVRLHAISKSEDYPLPRWTKEQAKDYLLSLGIKSSKEIPVSLYDGIIETFKQAAFWVDVEGQVKIEEETV